ncbi:MAG: hypothetical protein BGO49_31325 [Planctomycetales bacterium 71-10]|nr:MAG: hypothetical protein BGO49_31325 [Planctomycetales bacterium 71-10]
MRDRDVRPRFEHEPGVRRVEDLRRLVDDVDVVRPVVGVDQPTVDALGLERMEGQHRQLDLGELRQRLPQAEGVHLGPVHLQRQVPEVERDLDPARRRDLDGVARERGVERPPMPLDPPPHQVAAQGRGPFDGGRARRGGARRVAQDERPAGAEGEEAQGEGAGQPVVHGLSRVGDGGVGRADGVEDVAAQVVGGQARAVDFDRVGQPRDGRGEPILADPLGPVEAVAVRQRGDEGHALGGVGRAGERLDPAGRRQGPGGEQHDVAPARGEGRGDAVGPGRAGRASEQDDAAIAPGQVLQAVGVILVDDQEPAQRRAAAFQQAKRPVEVIEAAGRDDVDGAGLDHIRTPVAAVGARRYAP